MGRRGDNPTRDYWRGRHAIYRCYGGGELLYIGVSSDVAERLAAHRRTSPWFSDVERVVIKIAANRMQAFVIEKTAIRAERPLHNVRHIAA